MDGAVEAGERAAFEIGQLLRRDGYLPSQTVLRDPTLPEREHAVVRQSLSNMCGCCDCAMLCTQVKARVLPPASWLERHLPSSRAVVVTLSALAAGIAWFAATRLIS